MRSYHVAYISFLFLRQISHKVQLNSATYHMLLCFCKQKTAYEMRISDWSSDVCSSDLHLRADGAGESHLRDRRGCDPRLASLHGSNGRERGGGRQRRAWPGPRQRGYGTARSPASGGGGLSDQWTLVLLRPW